MKKIKKFFKKDTFAEHVGIELLELSEGKAKARLKIKEDHLNAVDVVHGGAIFTLADLAFAAASNSHGTVALAINANISFLKSVGKGATLTAEAKEISRNPKLATYSILVTNDEKETIAIFQGTVYRKKDKITT